MGRRGKMTVIRFTRRPGRPRASSRPSRRVTRYGYARIPTREQNLVCWVAALYLRQSRPASFCHAPGAAVARGATVFSTS
jgi:hypothetical protein